MHHGLPDAITETPTWVRSRSMLGMSAAEGVTRRQMTTERSNDHFIDEVRGS